MSVQIEQRLKAALQRVDDRLVAMQCRHRERGDIPLYEADLGPPATDQEMKQLENALGFAIPFELAYCLERWKGRFIAPDHAIVLNPISDLIYAANRSAMRVDDLTSTFEGLLVLSIYFSSPGNVYFLVSMIGLDRVYFWITFLLRVGNWVRSSGLVKILLRGMSFQVSWVC